jgi:outer membrane PBP1 activator LpoA protein
MAAFKYQTAKHSMRQAPSRSGSRQLFHLLIPLFFGLWGCAGAPEQDKPDTPVTPQPVAPAPQQGIDLTLPPSRFSDQFNSAEQSLAEFDWMGASVALAPLEEESLSPDDRTYVHYLQARIAYLRGQQERAMNALVSIEYPGVNPALQYRARSFRRHGLQLAGRHRESAQLGDQLLRSAPPAQRQALHREIWRDLQRLETGQLEQAMSTTADLRWYGWLELALIARSSGPGHTEDLATWRSNNPEHPAATSLPGGLEFLLQDEPHAAQQVALMLPLSGRLAPAGKAVLDGYLASYYAARTSGGRTAELLVLDLGRYDSAIAAYQDALARGATLVVGPLSKAAVADLGTLPERPVPILALNRAEQVLPASGSALVQMSLAPGDEAARVAELAYGRGARSALILRPAGSWGDKVEQALRQRWSALGGHLAGSATYSGRDEYSSAVKSGLDLYDSESRARDVRSMLATNIEFTARRRQDVDAIFLLSRNGPEARSIKPLLAFHYAGSVPVYATSSIYSGIPDQRDKDLNDINLVEIPWLLGASPGLRVAIAAGGTGSDNYTRLNALGADAFLLQTRFTQLQAGPDVLLRGNTGLLSMDSQLRLHRELSLATFDGGALRARKLD